MFTITLQATLRETFGAVVELRTSVDGWAGHPLLGSYDAATLTWRFDLDYVRYAAGFSFKFFLQPDVWQSDPDLQLAAADLMDGQTYPFRLNELKFNVVKPTGPTVELGRAQRRLFNEEVDPTELFDVIVIGSGMAGGTLANYLSDSGMNVLLLEAGGLLFPTHVGNLPREQKPGVFTKHLWELWDEFSVQNYDSAAGSDYIGGQGYNLGGRSLFWGAFIPRMTSWELSMWPGEIKRYLEDAGYLLAEEFMGRSTGPRTLYNRDVHLLLRRLFPDMNHVDAPVAVRQKAEGANSIATGVFSTADVLIESWLTYSPSGRDGLHIQLNHEAVRVDSLAAEANVIARDLRRDRQVTFRGKAVVLCAGCIESARLAARSGFPGGAIVGQGMSDHPIFFTHFSVPRQSPYFDPYGGVKSLSQFKESKNPAVTAPFNMLLELGADLNQGRYLDERIWFDHLETRKERMLCEIVFLCNEKLNSLNSVQFSADARARPEVLVKKYQRPDLLTVTDDLKWKLLKTLGAQPTSGAAIDSTLNEPAWRQAFIDRGDQGEGMPGGVAHEVGSLRMEVRDDAGAVAVAGVVDQDCRYIGLPGDNVYVCDLSVFPTTPAANPSLTVVALAIRLANHLSDILP